MLNFTATKEEKKLIAQIADRAIVRFPQLQKVDIMMDLEATHSNGTPMDFERMLAAPDFDFFHDIVGIYNNMDRTTGELMNCFLPRYARSCHEWKPAWAEEQKISKAADEMVGNSDMDELAPDDEMARKLLADLELPQEDNYFKIAVSAIRLAKGRQLGQ